MTTKEMLDRCFTDDTSMPESFIKKRTNIDKPLLFEYETEIGKQLVDMDVNEITELIFRNAKGNVQNQPYIAVSYVSQLAMMLRKIMKWYGDNIDLTHNNIFGNPKLKSKNLLMAVIKKAGRISWSDVEVLISKLHNEPLMNWSVNGVDYTRADYVELVMLLFYSGFSKQTEILEFKEVDLENKSVVLPDRTVVLTDRTFELLTAFHSQGALPTPNRNTTIYHKLLSWHGSYFKFPVRQSQVDVFDNRSETAMRNRISDTIQHWIGKTYSNGICMNALFWLGIHDRLAEKFGEDELRTMILNHNQKDFQRLVSALNNSGVLHLSADSIMNNLLQFVI